MTTFVDTNIPMYLVGAAHPNRELARAALEDAVDRGERLVTDAEVLQEILHRYVAIGRRDALGAATTLVLDVVDEVYSVDLDAVLEAGRLVGRIDGLSARDAIHLATMRRHGVDDILSFDTGFDRVTGIRRRPADQPE